MAKVMRRMIFDKSLNRWIPFEQWQKKESEKISYRQRLSYGLRRPASENSQGYDYSYRASRSETASYDFTQ